MSIRSPLYRHRIQGSLDPELMYNHVSALSHLHSCLYLTEGIYYFIQVEAVFTELLQMRQSSCIQGSNYWSSDFQALQIINPISKTPFKHTTTMSVHVY